MTKDEGLATEVRRVEGKWIEAYLDGDVGGSVYTSERDVFDKQSYVRNLASGTIEARGLRNDDLEVRLARVWVTEGGTRRGAALSAKDVPREV